MFLYSEWFHVYIVTELIRTSDSAIHALEKRNFIQGKVALRGEGNIVVLEKKISCKSSFIFIVVWNIADSQCTNYKYALEPIKLDPL